MNSLKQKSHFDNILFRINKLSPESQGKWGKMNVNEMLFHLNQSFDAANGKLKFNKEPLFFILSNHYIKKFVIQVLPWPRNMLTANSYKGSAPAEFEANRTKLIAAMNVFFNQESSSPHPIFGEMDNDLWGQLQYKHCDHHLKQFSV